MAHDVTTPEPGRAATLLVADENLPQPIVQRLLADGWNVVAITKIAPGASDEVVLGHAESADAILITSDRDFGELAFVQRRAVRGIVLLQLERLSLPQQAARASTCIAEERDKLLGNFLVVEPGRVRRRPLRQQ